MNVIGKFGKEPVNLHRKIYLSSTQKVFTISKKLAQFYIR